MSAAIEKIEQHLDNPEISEALGTLQEAMSPISGMTPPSAFVAGGGPQGSETATPKKRRRSFAMASTKRSASMQLREKTLAGLSAGAIAEGDACEVGEHVNVLVGGLDATTSGAMER